MPNDFLKAIYHGDEEGVIDYLKRNPSFPPTLVKEAGEVLPKIVNRSVWHRPQYHRIGKALVEAGVSCSIWDAARLGLLEAVQNCLARDGALLNAKDPQGRTPMQRAALIYGTHPECEEVVDFLLKRGAEVDLSTASTFSMPEAILEALDRNPLSLHEKVQGSTALNWAVRPRTDGGSARMENAIESCRILLAAGAAVDTKDDFEEEMQPLHHVAEWGGEPALPLAALLIEYGADLNAHSSQGWTPLDYAVDRDREPMIAYLTHLGAERNTQTWPNEFGPERDAIITAAQQGDLPTATDLLQKNPALAKARETSGATPLHWAGHNGYHDLAALLLANGADVTAQETLYWGGTPLHWAAERQVSLVKLLLEHGADVRSRNVRNGQTPLHYCARCDDSAEVAEILIRAGADPDAVDSSGKTPLAYAEQANHQAVAAFLQSLAPRS